MRLAIVFLALPLAIPSAFAQPAKVAELQWLEGCWEIVRPTSRVVEKWITVGDQMIGESHSYSGGFEREGEKLRLFVRADTLIYEATPSGQSRTEFKLQSAAGEHVFANPDHDFPQRIVYRRVGPDSLVARIEGDRAGRRAPVSYPYRKAPCPASFEAPGSVIQAALQRKYDDLASREMQYGGATNGWLADNAGDGFQQLSWAMPSLNPTRTARDAFARANEFFKANPNRIAVTNRQFTAKLEQIFLRGADTADVMVSTRHAWNFVDTAATYGERGATRLREANQKRLDRWRRAGTDWQLTEVQILTDEILIDGRLVVRNGRAVRPDSTRRP